MMHFSVHKADLLHGVQVTCRAISSARLTEPLFLNLLLEANEDNVVLAASNPQLSIKRRIQARDVSPGDVCVPGGLLQEILQGLQSVPAEGVEVSLGEDRRLAIDSEGASYHLSGTDAETYPRPVRPEGEVTFTLPAETLRKVVRQVLIVGTGGNSEVVQGYDEVLIESRESSLCVVATDSVRLAKRDVAPVEGADPFPEFELKFPMSSMAELAKVLPAEGDVEVCVGSHQVGFYFGDTDFISRTSERVFPNYRQILPSGHTRTIKVSAKELNDSIRGVIPLARENKNRIQLRFEDGRVIVGSSSPEMLGDARREVAAQLEGEPVELNFNAKFLLDFLGVVDSDGISIGVSHSTYPASLQPDVESPDFTYILMPINI